MPLRLRSSTAEEYTEEKECLLGVFLSMSGYHIKEITRGVYGHPSKIQEELDELIDAVEQGNSIMAMCECADIYGALETVADSLGVSMEDLRRMSDATKRAFKDGTRK